MKKVTLYAMTTLYVAAGILHFAHPASYLLIMPHWLPFPVVLVAISGAAEILFGLLLLPGATRRIAAWLIILLLIAIFPANIQMAVNYWQEDSAYLWVAVIRLPLQAVLVWWASLYARADIKKKKAATIQ